MVIPQVLALIKERGGILLSREATKSGIRIELLRYLVQRGKLAHPERGVYTLPEIFDDAFYFKQSKFTRGIFSHACAAYLHRLSDRTPHEEEMTFPHSYNTTCAQNEGIVCHKSSAKFYGKDIVSLKTPQRNSVQVYSMPRTICDLFRAVQYPSDEEIKILRKYLTLPGCDLHDLVSLMKEFRIDKKLRPYLESFTCTL